MWQQQHQQIFLRKKEERKKEIKSFSNKTVSLSLSFGLSACFSFGMSFVVFVWKQNKKKDIIFTGMARQLLSPNENENALKLRGCLQDHGNFQSEPVQTLLRMHVAYQDNPFETGRGQWTSA